MNATDAFNTSYQLPSAATPQTMGAFNATDAFMGSSPAMQYSQAVQQSPALPGGDGGMMSQMQKYGMYGSMIGEAAHGVGNLVRAFKGMDPVKYPGTTLAQQASNRRKVDMQMKILDDLFGPPKTDMQEGIEQAEEAGAPSVSQDLDTGMEETAPSAVEELPVEPYDEDGNTAEQTKDELIQRVKATRAAPFLSDYERRGESLPRHIQDMLAGKNTLQ